MQVSAKVNTIEVEKALKNISRKQKSVIDKSLKRVSNMAIQMITTRTQKVNCQMVVI